LIIKGPTDVGLFILGKKTEPKTEKVD